MQSAIDAFDASLARVRHLHGLHDALRKQLTSAVDLSDLLRAEIVMSISALDHYIHEISRKGMIECWTGQRPMTQAFEKFPIPISQTRSLASTNPTNATAILDSIIRQKHGYESFQKPTKIADAIRLFCSINLWKEVGHILGQSPDDVKNTLGLIIDRRNKIAHEADVDPSYPNQLWPVNRLLVENILTNIENIAHAIHRVCA